MKFLLAIVLISLFPQTGSAGPFGFIGRDYRLENNSSGNGKVSREAWLGGLGINYEYLGLSADLKYYSFESNTSYLIVKTDHYEGLFWARYSPFKLLTWFPFAELGVGLQQSVVETQFIGQINKSYGVLYGVFGGGLGIWNQVFRGVSVGIHLRMLWRPKVSPQESYDFIGVAGYQF